MTSREYIGRTMRDVREAANRSQVDLARELGHKDSSQLNRWENGKRIPSIEAFCHVCVLCGMDPSSVIGGMSTWRGLLENDRTRP